MHHPPYAASRLLKGRYVVTGDTLLKMVAIFVRLRCGVPVIVMGECGCGKTMLLSYLCAWLQVSHLCIAAPPRISANLREPPHLLAAAPLRLQLQS